MNRPKDSNGSMGFLEDVGRQAHRIDGPLLLLAPAVLVAVHTLPTPTRAGLVFDRAAPSLMTAFSAHFVHLEAAHLLGNLVVYALVVPVVYLLLLLGGRRSEFLAVLAVILSLFPLVLTALGTLVIGRGTLLGFSGLAMAFVGVLPVATFLFLDGWTTTDVGLDDAPILFFGGMALIAVRVVPVGLGLVVAAVATAFALVYLLRIVRSVPRPWLPRVRGLLRRSGYLELGLGSPVVFAVAILAAFPADPVRSDAVVDLFGHLIGYSLGFLAIYLTVQLDRAVGGPAGPSRPESTSTPSETGDAPDDP